MWAGTALALLRRSSALKTRLQRQDLSFCRFKEADQQFLSKFPQGTVQHQEVLKFKADLEELRPAEESTGASTGSPATVRAVGGPDLSGADCLDVTREVDLEKIPDSSFSADKPLD